MVPPYGPAGTSRAFPQRIAGTLVGQEHAPTETSRPLSTGPHPSFATPLIGFGAHGARPSVCGGFHVFLVLGQFFRIVVIMRLRILATIAIDPLFEIIRTKLAINSCTSPRSHFGTSSVPPPTTMGADPASTFFGVKSPYTSSKRAPFRPVPFGFTPRSTSSCCNNAVDSWTMSTENTCLKTWCWQLVGNKLLVCILRESTKSFFHKSASRLARNHLICSRRTQTEPFFMFGNKFCARMCARAYKPKKHGKVQGGLPASQLFSAMPSVEAAKVFAWNMMSVVWAATGERLNLTHCKISCVDCQGTAQRLNHVRFPAEDQHQFGEDKWVAWARACTVSSVNSRSARLSGCL